MEVTIGKSITTKINIANKEFLPVGSVLKKGIQPKKLCKKTKNALKKGSITNIAQSPNTTEGIAASNSTKDHLYLLKKYGQIAPLVYFLGALSLKNPQQNHLGLTFLQ